MSAFFDSSVYAAVQVKDLRVEYMRNPIGIDVEKPRFSWRMEANERGAVQSAYEIAVSTDEAGTNVVWNSGKVENDKSVHILYGGNTLQAATRYYWTVSVWDNAGAKTVSTEKAFFETGLMNTGWSDAKWLRATGKAQEEHGGINPLSITKYTVEMDFTVKAVCAGIIFGAEDNNNFYMWQINLQLGGAGKTLLRPHSWRGGGPSGHGEIDITSKFNVQFNQKYTIRIEVDGDKASTYINDILVDGNRVNPRGGNYGFGKIGFRANLGSDYSPEETYYDNIKVTAHVDGTPTLMFEEDFSDAANFGFSGGTVDNGQLYVKGTGSTVFCWQQEKGASGALDYALEMDMTLLRDNAGIIFSAADQSYFLMWAFNTVGSTNTTLRRHFYAGGNPSSSDVALPAALNKAYFIDNERRIKIEVKGNVIKTYVGGTLIDTYTDTSGLLMLGAVGFRMHNGASDERARFDNIVLTDYSSGSPVIVLNEDFEDIDNIFNSIDVVDVAGDMKLNMYSSGGERRVFSGIADGISMFRSEFELAKQVKSARIYASALGVYNMFINGQRIGTPTESGELVYDELNPGWTDFSKTVFYNTYDVTQLLQQGANVLGAYVASGWWSGRVARGVYGNGETGFIAKLVINYTDGTSKTVITDPATWLSSKGGAIRAGDIFEGEEYDARLESDWTMPAFDASDWRQTALNTRFNGIIKAYIGPRVQVRPELQCTPVEIKKYNGTTASGTTHGMVNVTESYTTPTSIALQKGETLVYDMGQNMVGWIKFKVKGAAGTRLTFRFAEILNDNGNASRGNDGPGGSLYVANLRSAKATLSYTLKGDESGETFNPTTTFFGFRYCDVIATQNVEIEYLYGEVVGTVAEEGSSIVTSNSAVNQLYQNVMWGQRGNFLSIASDCPQRDERQGWTGDIQVFGRTATYNADLSSFFHKWTGDMRDSQYGDGAYPDKAPNDQGGGNAGWADAGLVIPWTVYLMYGNIGILEENFASMEKYMSYLAGRAGDGYLYNGGGTAYGDWVAPEGTDSRYVSVCFYAYAALLMEKISKAMSKAEGDTYSAKASSYKTLYGNIKNEFQTRYVNANGTLKHSSQTAYLLALKLDLFPNEAAKTAGIQFLNQKIAGNGDKLSTGFLGTGILNQTLSDVGSTATAYNLLLQRNYPSWLYTVDQGATTIWERWNSYTIDRGFGDVSMNSFNHYANGAVAEWMYRYMAGIEPDEENPGFKHFILQPTPDNRSTLPAGQERMTSVSASYPSYYGEIRSEWTRKDDGRIVYKATVPANATATLYLPVMANDDVVFESGVLAENAEGITFERKTGTEFVYTLQAGSYTFEVKDKSNAPSLNPQTFSSLNIYPNPVTDNLVITESADFTIFDMKGRKVLTGNGSTVDVSLLKDGIYCLHANGSSFKFIKMRN